MLFPPQEGSPIFKRFPIPAPLLALGLVAAAFLAGLVFLPALKDWFLAFLRWVEELGVWGPVVLGATYVLATVVLFPGSILTLGAGAIFGLVRGFIAVSLGSVFGAAAAFWVGRTVARGWVERRVAASPRFRAIDQAVGWEGFKIVLLTRLSPLLPFTLLNYAFGLTRVRFRDYFWASWLGMIPGTLLYIYLGTTLRSLAEAAAGAVHKGASYYVFLGLGLLATVAVTVFVTRLARRALRQAVAEEGPKTEGPAAPAV